MNRTPPTLEQIAAQTANDIACFFVGNDDVSLDEGRKLTHEFVLRALEAAAKQPNTATLGNVTDFAWAVGSIEGVLRGIRTTEALLPNQIEAIDDALKQVQILKSLDPLSFGAAKPPEGAGDEAFGCINDHPAVIAIRTKHRDKILDELAEAFIRWPLPDSVRADPCATMPEYKDRIGTNLLTVVEARQMMEEVVLPVIRRHAHLDGQVAGGEEDKERLDLLEKLLKNCPHTELGFHDSEEQVEFCHGFRVYVGGCDPIEIEAEPTLRSLLDALRKEVPQFDEFGAAMRPEPEQGQEEGGT